MRMKSKGNFHLVKMVQKIIDEEGEGAIIRRVNSLYESGRSSSLLKLKSAQADKEAIVVGISDNGDVKLKLPTGQIFTVPASRVQTATPAVPMQFTKSGQTTKRPLQIGDVVTFSYEVYSRRAVPIRAQVLRIRTDVDWQDVVQGELRDAKFINDGSKIPNFTTHPLGHWNDSNIRKFLESFARNLGLDPLLPESWYSIPEKSIRSVPDGAAVLQKIKGGYVGTLQRAFPEISFDPSSFPIASWRDIRSRRSFFEKYAKEHNFDAQIADHWYSEPPTRIMEAKGAFSVMAYYSHSIPKALLSLFPNIGLVKSKFPITYSWSNPKKRKQFFEDYAKRNNFDPLVADNWYRQSRSDLLTSKEISRVLFLHKNSLTQALMDLFPNIGLDPSKFRTTTSWSSMRKRKRFFENYAKENNFDPLVPDNWYIQSRTKILSHKSASTVVSYHKHNVVKALCDLFPNIGLDPSKFMVISLWREPKNRRNFFEEYAKDNGFDPLDPDEWHSLSLSKIMFVKGARRVMFYHNDNVVQALLDLFPEIGLDKTQLKSHQTKWGDREERRRFFEEYATKNGFDCKSADQWYLQPRERILSAKGIKGVLCYHNKSVSKALQDLFPDVPFSKSKLRNMPSKESDVLKQWPLQYWLPEKM